MSSFISGMQQSLDAGWQQPLKWMERVRLPRLVTLLLLVVLAWQLAEITWKLVPGEPEMAQEIAVTRQVKRAGTAAPDPGAGDYGRVAGHHLFGKVVVAKQAPRVVPREAPVTKLNLVLYGVFTDVEPQQGGAIIGKAGAEQRYYHTGDSVGTGTRLAEVYEDHVILERNSQYETLYFPQGARPASQNGAGRATAANANHAVQPGANLAAYRDVLKGAPQKLMEYLQFVPVKINGELQGFRILPKKDRDFYSKLGVTAADVITAVNGISVAGTPEIPRLMQELDRAEQLVLQIKRRGREETVTVSLN